MKKLTLLLLACLSLVGCGHDDPNTLKVGTISGPETDLMQVAKQVAKQRFNLTIKIVEFNDYNIPNIALSDGSLDANVYQHLPYLKAAITAHGYPLEAIGKTFIYPTGIYSHKYKSLSQLPDNALVAIPNDPSNEARALLLLQTQGLIKLKQADNPTTLDIIDNPKKLQFKAMDAAQLPRVLPDVAIAIINTNYALPAKLNPKKDAIALEGKDSPYANLIVVRKDSKKMPQLKKLVKALNSPQVAEKAKQLFQGQAISAWDNQEH